jgi:hypothetical protein
MNAPRARDTLAKRCARTGEIGFGYEVEGGFSSPFAARAIFLTPHFRVRSKVHPG